MPKVSIIVPVYKAERYIRRCVDSIVAQTFADWELLLVDDGSPDRSGEICDEYAERDGRIRVFHKENGGVSSARQKGLDEALGEYCIHTDPDDWVENKMLEELYLKAREGDNDMVICDFFQNKGGEQKYVRQEPTAIDCKSVMDNLLSGKLHGSMCNKLVRRDCYKRYDIKFPDNMNCWEDLYVNISLLLHSDIKIAYCPNAFYHYDCAENPNSLVRKPTKQTVLSQKYMIDELSPILGNAYSEVIYHLKEQTKILAWQHNLMNENEYKALFPEISERYITAHKNCSDITKRFVSFSLHHYKTAKALYVFLLNINKVRHSLYGK